LKYDARILLEEKETANTWRGAGAFAAEGAPVASELLLSAENFVWGLQRLCQLHRVPFAPNLVVHQFPPPYSLLTLQQAAQALGLKSGLREIRAADLARLPTPFLAVLEPPPPPAHLPTHRNAAAKDEPKRPHRLAIVIKVGGDSISYAEENAQAPITVPSSEFGRQFTGKVVLCIPETPALHDRDAALNIRPEFGFRWFIPELLRYRTIWRDVLLASLAIQLMALATPVFTQITIDKVIVHRTTNTLVVIGIALGVFVLFTAAMSWVRQYLVLHTGNRIDAVLGSQVFEHLFRLPPRYFEARPTGVLVARVQGVETIREFLSSAAVTLILDVPFLVVFLAIMFYYSVALTLITVTVLTAIAVLSLAITPQLRERINRQFLLGARNQAFLTEYVAGMETVKSLQMEPQLGARYGDYLATYLQAGFETRRLANTYNVTAHGLEQAMMVAILCLGAWTVMQSTGFTVGMLVAFQMFASRLAQPMLHLVGLWQQFQQADIAVKRLGDIMNTPAEPYSVVPAREARGEGRIEMRGLGFRYGENLPYLFRHLNLVIKPGNCVAIMGPSGSGKSTLAKLLQGFYLPTEGEILLDGLDARHLSANELRQHFGVVPQETVLFSGTVYENLILGDSHATFERVVRACKLAEIHDVIERLPEGYQTRIGEHGVGLSGGQKQRIAIARALLKRPRILIFDEATNSLDAPTAEQFAQTVNRLRGKVTMLFIAHQLPRGLQVDRVTTLGLREVGMSARNEDRRDA
jgi:ATP-binding cassette, subfamily B, bacterial HlyB/CyaB